jgi:enoyl-CoA hydratase
LPEVGLGYIPSAGGTQTLPRTVPAGIAREMIFAGESIDAQRALAIGLVTRVVPRNALDDEVRRVAERLASSPQATLRAAKEAMIRGASLLLDGALVMETTIAGRVQSQPST